VALFTTIIADACSGSGSVLANVQGYRGIQSLGGSQILHLWDLHSAQADGLFQFGKPPVEVVQVTHDGLPVVQARC